MNSDASSSPLFTDLNDADPVVVRAIDQAKKTLPHFLEAASTKQFAPANYLVKVPLIDRSETRQSALVRTAETIAENSTRPICRLWLGVTSVLDELIFCSVGEAPDALRLSPGTSFVVDAALVEDWLINHEGIVFGGFSLRVIRSRLSKDEQLKFDAHTGIREFRTLVR
jgi:uncharacterized protein YegJ (DUF2314 family)